MSQIGPTTFRNAPRLVDHGRRELRADALAMAAAALAAVDPAAALRQLIRVEGDELIVRGAPWVGLRPPGGAPTATVRGSESPAEPVAVVRPPDRAEAIVPDPVDTVVPLAGGRVFVVGAGKAGLGIAALLDELLGPRLSDAAVVVKRGQAAQLPRPLRHIEVLEAAHPVPDESSLAGGRRLLEVARQARAGDLVIGIVTGGSSALAVAPAGGITLDDKIATNRLLLACGADIVSINNVRKHLSAIKGGLLAAAAGCRIVNFTVSDVVGDPLDYVTDLTVPDRSTWAMAHDTCDRFGLWGKLPARVADRLRRAAPEQETPNDLPGTAAGEALTWVVADAEQMCAAAAEEARRLGYAPRLLGLDWEGEARDAGAALARELLASPLGTCLLAGGENTVTLPPDRHGHGGPSQEAALAAALVLAAALGPGAAREPGAALEPAPTVHEAAAAARGAVAAERAADEKPATGTPAVVLCLDSDGTDGPTDAAGGLVDDLSAGVVSAGIVSAGVVSAGIVSGPDRGPAAPIACRAGESRVAAANRIETALAEHTAHDALAALGDLVFTGPTDTNVNDLKIGLRAR